MQRRYLTKDRLERLGELGRRHGIEKQLDPREVRQMEEGEKVPLGKEAIVSESPKIVRGSVVQGRFVNQQVDLPIDEVLDLPRDEFLA